MIATFLMSFSRLNRVSNPSRTQISFEIKLYLIQRFKINHKAQILFFLMQQGKDIT